MKIPFLSRLLEIKEEQLEIENQNLEIQLEIKDRLRKIYYQLSNIQVRLKK